MCIHSTFLVLPVFRIRKYKIHEWPFSFTKDIFLSSEYNRRTRYGKKKQSKRRKRVNNVKHEGESIARKEVEK